MKKKVLSFVSVLSSLLLIALAFGQVKGGLPLDVAVAKGMVTAKFSASGGSSGDTMIGTFQKTRNAGKGTLTLTIPHGLKLNSSNSSVQNMVVSGIGGRDLGGGMMEPASEIELSDNKPVSYVLTAYCANFAKDNPSEGNRFTLSRNKNDLLACVLSEAEKRNLSVQATQAAVWIVTDNVSFDEMSHKFPVSASDWKKAKAVVSHCRKKKR